MKKKTLLLMSLLPIGVVTLAVSMNSYSYRVSSAYNTYQISCNCSKNKLTNKTSYSSGSIALSTERGSSINFTYSNVKSNSDIWCDLSTDGYFYNTDPIQYLNNITFVTATSGSEITIYGSNTSSFTTTESFTYTSGVDQTFTCNLSSYNFPYFMLASKSEVSITSLVVDFSCSTTYPFVSVSSDDTDMGTVKGEGFYSVGSSVTLTATANDGYEFLGWYKNNVLESSNNPYTFLMDANDVSYVGKFQKKVNVDSEGRVETNEAEVDVSSGYSTISLNSSNISVSGSYTTNFSSQTTSGATFYFYRFASNSSAAVKLYAYSSLADDDSSLPGALFNTSAISNIRKIELTYNCSNNIKVSFGQNQKLDKYTMLSSSNNVKKEVYLSENTNFFMIETTSSDLEIDEVKIYYKSNSNSYSTDKADIQKGTRIAATRTTSSLSEGLTMDMPIGINKVDNTYSVTEYKTYTYHTYSYAQQHSSEISSISMTDPVDVVNYYLAFDAIPANFGYSNTLSVNNSESVASKSNVTSTFGSYARCVAQYSRTTGYATDIPYNTYSGGSPRYLEFDIALNSTYSTSNRDVGRIVMWVDGFTCYGSDPVATLTRDHYMTFQEYNNYGGWNQAFDTSGYYRIMNGFVASTTLTEK